MIAGSIMWWNSRSRPNRQHFTTLILLTLYIPLHPSFHQDCQLVAPQDMLIPRQNCQLRREEALAFRRWSTLAPSPDDQIPIDKTFESSTQYPLHLEILEKSPYFFGVDI